MSLISKLKSSWENGQYAIWKEVTEETVITNEEKVCVFDMRHLVPGRRISQMYMQFTNVGIRCLFYYPNYFSWVKSCFLKNWNYWNIAIKRGTVITEIPNHYDLVVAKKGKRTIKSSKILYFEDRMMDEIQKHIEERFFFPILFHPEKMQADIEKECLVNGTSSRKIGILFIGNNDLTYKRNTHIIHKKYNIHTRTEVIENIKKYLGDYIYSPNSYDELIEHMQNGELIRKIVIIDKFRVKKEYINLLKQSNFFICTAGVMMPYCHNHIESIACGCVPIIEFAELYPGLKEVAVNYNGMEELIAACEKICCEYKTDCIERAVKVQEYYRKYWGFEKFGEKVNEFFMDSRRCDTYYVAENYRRFWT